MSTEVSSEAHDLCKELSPEGFYRRNVFYFFFFLFWAYFILFYKNKAELTHQKESIEK